jgi:hypothetical protein
MMRRALLFAAALTATQPVAGAGIPLAAAWQRDRLAIVACVQELRGRTILASASARLK